MALKIPAALILFGLLALNVSCSSSNVNSQKAESPTTDTAPVTAVSSRSEVESISAQKTVVTPSQRQDLPVVSVAEDFLTTMISVADFSKAHKGKLDSDAKKRLQDLSVYVDVVALSKRSLGSRWASLPKSQRDEFISTLTEILEEVVYPNAVKISAKSDEFTYKMAPKTKNVVVVNGAIEREKQGEMIVNPFEMKLEFDLKTKKIVDAVIEKEAISANLKRQFDRALEKKNFAAIIDMMKKRVAKARQEKGNSAGA